MWDDPMITVVCWKWKKHDGFAHDYTAEHVNTLQRMVARHYPHPHRFVCITDDPRGIECNVYPLWGDLGLSRNACGEHLPSCYRRLYLFSNDMAKKFGGRIVSLDLDVVITGDLSPLWNRDDTFVGWRQKALDPRLDFVYNGSMWMFKAGHHSDLWDTFRVDTSPILTRMSGYYGSDQAWISYRLKNTMPYWDESDGVYSYPRGVRNHGLPANARIVMFNGKRKPWEHTKLLKVDDWVKEYYR